MSRRTPGGGHPEGPSIPRCDPDRSTTTPEATTMNPKTLEIRHTCAAIARVSRAQAMPSSPIRGAAVLPYVIAGALALAVTAAAAKGAAGRCTIEIDGTRFVDGSCRIERTPEGGVRLSVERPQPYEVRMGAQYAGQAVAVWSGDRSRVTREPENLGLVTRTGPDCLSNVRARLCFWTTR